MGLFSRKRSRTEEEPEVEAADGEELDEVDALMAASGPTGTDEPDDELGADPDDDEAEVVATVADDEAADDDSEDEADTGETSAPDAEDDTLTDGGADDVPDADAQVADSDAEDEAGGEADGEGSDDEDDTLTDGDDELEDSGQVEFELGDWGARERQLLDGELAAARVRRAWEAGTLVVAAADADVVDDLIDYIEERIALDLSPDVEPVIYEVRDWPPGLEERFIELLIENRIAHNRGYQEVTVGVDDEERVDELVEKVTAAWEEEQPTDEELDGPDAQEVLSELFVSSDRLLHSPSDKAATVRFDDAAESAVTMSLPFGFDEATWTEITELTTVLRDQLSEVESSDDEIVEAATALRTALRPLV